MAIICEYGNDLCVFNLLDCNPEGYQHQGTPGQLTRPWVKGGIKKALYNLLE